MLPEGASDLIRVSAQAVLGSSWTQIFQAPFQSQVAVSIIHLANTSTGPLTVSLCAVPSGGSPAQGNALLYGFSIPANDFIELGDGLILLSGGYLTAQASFPAVISVFMSGFQF